MSHKGLTIPDNTPLHETNIQDEGVLVLMEQGGGREKSVEAAAAAAAAAATAAAAAASPESRKKKGSRRSKSKKTKTKSKSDDTDSDDTDSDSSSSPSDSAALKKTQAELLEITALLQAEIKKGLAREEEMKAEMERRVKGIEENIRHEVRQELNLQGAASKAEVGSVRVPVAKVSQAGDLESDDDCEEVLTRSEISKRMAEAEARARKIEEEMQEERTKQQALVKQSLEETGG